MDSSDDVFYDVEDNGSLDDEVDAFFNGDDDDEENPTTSDTSNPNSVLTDARSTTITATGPTTISILEPLEHPRVLLEPSRAPQDRLRLPFRRPRSNSEPTAGADPVQQRKRDPIRARFRRVFGDANQGDGTRVRSRDRLVAKFLHVRSQVIQNPATKPTDALTRKYLQALTGSIPVPSLSLDAECIVCWDSPRASIFYPCGHLNSCLHCSKSLKHCPTCRVRVGGIVEITCISNEVLADHGCAVCQGERDGLFYPCGHVCFCHKCSVGVQSCPVCEKKVEQIVRVFWS